MVSNSSNSIEVNNSKKQKIGNSVESNVVDKYGLCFPAGGTLKRKNETDEEKEIRLKQLTGAVTTILECLGEDPNREGLLKTPERYAKALLFFTEGYEKDINEVVNNAVFEEDHNGMVIVKDIEIFSLCEHHLVPFSGKIHIAYIPNKKVIGLSKIARITEMISRRLQIQERITKQVSDVLEEVLQPKGIAIVMESSHFCMVMRGVQKTQSFTITCHTTGVFKDDIKLKDEFLSLIKH
ncbi:GTP cyclohydrolase I [Neocallimastix lanati (nom. inval.)]|jgi:GTP cyclohydrolase I|uniref:GTP cyclohydrolase 1 n=1 Tax=Neocallimastix californiae TaxID=1754190 RepID=A0A1Y2A2V3_9FUNG|nr:GTP cyclohydrolase I [Neocallimastix sp. JGI-2020a]ORY16861.1 GTP cyclohydrolase I [Neocallimastix californiae]|eukprot:ORY16861.1 GTP cyclohydrolase I [Neocallimastix californiae]